MACTTCFTRPDRILFTIGRFRLNHFQFSVLLSLAVIFLSKCLGLLMNDLDILKSGIGNSTILVFMLAGRPRACVSWPCYCKSDHGTCRSLYVLYEKYVVQKILYFADFLTLWNTGKMRGITSHHYRLSARHKMKNISVIATCMWLLPASYQGFGDGTSKRLPRSYAL